MIRMFRRGLRLQWVAALGVALAIPALGATAASKQQATQTTLNVGTRDLNGRTQATLSMAVIGAEGNQQPVRLPCLITASRWPASPWTPKDA